MNGRQPERKASAALRRLGLCGALLLCFRPGAAHSSTDGRWAGPYAGVDAGYGWGRSNAPVTTEFISGGYFFQTDVRQVNDQGPARLHPRGPSAALNVGYNVQRGPWVAGLEAEGGLLHLRDARQLSVPYNSGPTATLRIRTESRADWLALLRLRGGCAVGDWLGSLNAGAALTQVRSEAVFEDDYTAGSGPSRAYAHPTAARLRLGWTVGASLERAVSSEWSVRVDGLYARFGRVSTTSIMDLNAAYAPANPITASADLAFFVARVGLTRRFGWR